MSLVDWAGRPGSPPLWRTCSEKPHQCQVTTAAKQHTCITSKKVFIFNIHISQIVLLCSVALERRRDGSSRQYSAEAEILIPDVVGTRMLGLMERKGPLWSSALRLKYGLGGESLNTCLVIGQLHHSKFWGDLCPVYPPVPVYNKDIKLFPSKCFDKVIFGSNIFCHMSWPWSLRPSTGDARHLRQECFMSQRLKSERDSNLTHILRADHEFYCSNTGPINHKVPGYMSICLNVILWFCPTWLPVYETNSFLDAWNRGHDCFFVRLQIHLKHEESREHIQSSLDMSYGKHWDEINNKRTILLSQSFKNQSTQNHTSYTLEVKRPLWGLEPLLSFF